MASLPATQNPAVKQLFGDPNFAIIPAPTLLNREHVPEKNRGDVRSREQSLTTSMHRVRDIMKNLQNTLPRDREVYSRLFNSAKLAIIDTANILQCIMREQRGALTEIQFCEYYAWIEICQVLALYNYAFLEEETALKEALNRINDYMFSTDANETIERLMAQTNADNVEDSLENLQFHSTVSFRDFSGRKELIARMENDMMLAGLRRRFTFYLFVGPPGTGKSELAQAMMTYVPNTEAYLLNMPELSGKYVGQTENLLKKLFTRAASEANKDRHFVIFLDEVDEVFSKDLPATSYLNTVATTLQTLLAGSLKLGNNVMFIAATNYKSLIRPTILDRVTKVFFVDTPEKSDITLYFRSVCNIPDNVTDPESEEYLAAEIVPFISSLPLQITYRNLNNIMSGAIDITMRLDKLYTFSMTVDDNDTIVATQKTQATTSTEINLTTAREIKEYVKKSTITVFAINRKILATITADGAKVYYRPSHQNLRASANDVIILPFDKYIKFLELNEQKTRRVDGVDVPIADLDKRLFEWRPVVASTS